MTKSTFNLETPQKNKKTTQNISSQSPEDWVPLSSLFGSKSEMYIIILISQGKAKMLAVFVASLMSFEKAYAQLRKDKADAEKFKQMVGDQQ